MLLVNHLVLIGYFADFYSSILTFLFDSKNINSSAVKGIALSYFVIILFPINEDKYTYLISTLVISISLVISIWFLFLNSSIDNFIIQGLGYLLFFYLFVTVLLNLKSKQKFDRHCQIIILTDMFNKTIYDWMYNIFITIGGVILIAVLKHSNLGLTL